MVPEQEEWVEIPGFYVGPGGREDPPDLRYLKFHLVTSCQGIGVVSKGSERGRVVPRPVSSVPEGPPPKIRVLVRRSQDFPCKNIGTLVFT